MVRIAVVIPAFNEENSIADVVNAILSVNGAETFSLTPVVVNDCSTDKTLSVVSRLNCIFLDLPINLGIGGAVQAGYRYAFENGFDYAVQVDGDGQHPVEAISFLLKYAADEDADVVIGSRFISKKGFQSSVMRRFGINYFKALNKLLVGVTVLDSTSGFRLINRRVLELVSTYYPDEYPEPEAIILYSMNGFRIKEVAVEMKERQSGSSSIGFFSSIYYMFKVSLAIIYTFIRLKFQKPKNL